MNGNLEADIHDQPEDVTMQDVPVDPGIKVQTPEEEQVSKDVMKEMSETVMTNADQEAQSKVHTPQELKGLGLDNALFDQEIAQDFGAAE